MTKHAEKPTRSKLQLEALALAAINHRAASVTVRRLSPPDRNWDWELASIQPVPSGHGQAQARESILPLQCTSDLENWPPALPMPCRSAGLRELARGRYTAFEAPMAAPACQE